MPKKKYPQTPDGRYFVSKGRLWRCTDPNLPEDERRVLVKKLMRARLAVKMAKSEEEEKEARKEVHTAKVALGERGPVWWEDGADPVDQMAPKNTPYADWWNALSDEERERGSA